MTSTALKWLLSATVSVALATALVMKWTHEDASYQPNPAQLVDEASVQAYLERHDSGQAGEEPRRYLPTGVFMQSLKFSSPSEIQITGYVWQTYTDGIHDGLSRGFILPEAVDSGDGVLEEAYRRRNGRHEVIGWYVEATLRQQFRYHRYPLDHKTAWMRLWHKDFDRNVVLTPDLAAYASTAPGESFGVDDAIVLGGWRLEETFFDYKLSSYDTDFGIRDYVGQSNFPELYFNVVMERDFLNALIINLIPLFVVAALLFSVVMLTTANERRAGLFGFNTAGVFATASALFFVILLAHIQLREQFPGGVVYLEWFYLLMYMVLLVVSVDTYRFAVKAAGEHYGPWDEDNLVTKLLYWPLLLGAMVTITYLAL